MPTFNSWKFALPQIARATHQQKLNFPLPLFGFAGRRLARSGCVLFGEFADGAVRKKSGVVAVGPIDGDGIVPNNSNLLSMNIRRNGLGIEQRRTGHLVDAQGAGAGLTELDIGHSDFDFWHAKVCDPSEQW